MDYMYVLIGGCDWDDTIIFLSLEDAIQKSINNPESRVEIFSKTNESGYRPTYNYYRNGKYIQTS